MNYNKTIAAAVGGVITWAYTALADNHVTTLEWVGLAAVVATAFGVYQLAGPSPQVEEPVGAVVESGAVQVSPPLGDAAP